QIAQQSRAAIALHNFLRRTSKVQIHEIEAEAFDNARRLSHDLRSAAKELRGDRMLVLVEMKIAFRLLIFGTEHSVGRSELGHDQPTSAEVAYEPPKNRVGDAGHRSKYGGRRNGHRTELNRLRDSCAGGLDTPTRRHGSNATV